MGRGCRQRRSSRSKLPALSRTRSFKADLHFPDHPLEAVPIMRTDLFDFDLPAANIALRPASPRDSARMLVVQPDGVLRDRSVVELPQWLEAGDQLVVNDTKVISAQLKGRRIGHETEPKIEATLIKRLDGSRWQALVK